LLAAPGSKVHPPLHRLIRLGLLENGINRCGFLGTYDARLFKKKVCISSCNFLQVLKQGRATTNKKEGKGAKQILVGKRARKEEIRSRKVSKLAVFQKKRGFFSIQCG
jgi:hypothetical protein